MSDTPSAAAATPRSSLPARTSDTLIRGLAALFCRLFYRIRTVGAEHIPATGGALLVCNHLSLIDALLLQAATPRPIRFLMFKDYHDRPLIRPLARATRAIPISSRQRPREMIQSLRTAADAIRNGELVCIFAEGQITRIGQLLPFRRGFERILRDAPAPVIPVCLDDVWGSIFSHAEGRFLWKFPRRIPYPVTVSIGQPLPPSATHLDARHAVQALATEAWPFRRERMLPLQRGFIRAARLHPLRFAMGDQRAPHVRFGSALIKTIFLARRLRPVWADSEKVGILLPPSVAGALVNWAALLLGKIPVNLNYTASPEVLRSCLAQCAIPRVVTSRAFLEKAKLEVPGPVVLLEDLAQKPRATEKLAALGAAVLLPARHLERWLGCRRSPTLDDPATVIFSSGSTGDPKGILLSHYNVVSNIEQLDQIFAVRSRDRFLGILPFFHSFGFTGILCLPGVLGCGVAFHPTPLDAEAIGEIVRNYNVSFLLATPTFLNLYTRGCDPGDFGSLDVVMAGAEKLPDRIAVAFEDKFGIRPYEGYGCTECSPAVTVNGRDFRSAGVRQVAAKRGRIGHPLPGISIRIVDVATNEPVAPGAPGVLWVRGPNVMQGYLGQPAKTEEVLRNGWYRTGDVAAEDEDGFLQITDRLGRFSKIGGEMIPHIGVEERLHELAGAVDLTFVVCGVPDEKKGERLVVLHTLPDDRLRDVLDRLPQSGLPNLWIPKASLFFRVEQFPLLGTGKLDLRRLRETSAAFAAQTPA